MNQTNYDTMKRLKIERVYFSPDALKVVGSNGAMTLDYLVKNIMELVEENIEAQYGIGDIVTLKNMPFEFQYYYNESYDRYELEID